MDISLKNKIAEKIIQSNDDVLLNEIKALVGLSESDFWAALSEEVKQSVNKAKSELDNGEGIPHLKVMSEIENQFLKK